MSRDDGYRRGGGPPPDTSRMVSLKVDGLSHRYHMHKKDGLNLGDPLPGF